MARRRATWTILICLMFATAASADELSRSPLAVTIRTYDYARIQPERIALAQAYVARIYADIGVRIRWADTVDSVSVLSGALDASPIGPQDLILMIQNPARNHRRTPRSNIIGFAAAARDQVGRVAYVLFDRVCNVAERSSRHEMDILGLVMAHEVGHLLLGGSHSSNGLMRAEWPISDLRVDRGQFKFTRTQAEGIRRSLER